MTRASLRFGSGPTIGLGHQSRMRALAGAFVSSGVETDIAVVGESSSAEIVVIDTYGSVSRADYPRSAVICVIDDLQRALDVDVVVDPTPTSEGNLVISPGPCSILRGSGFSLVDPQLTTLERRPIRGHVDSVLVATGGSPDQGVGSDIAKQLSESVPEVAVALAVRNAPKYFFPNGKVIDTDQGLGKWLAHSDVVISAGGVTMIESLTLARPTVAFDLYENQARAVQHSAELGCLVRSSPKEACKHTIALLADEAARKQLSARASRLFDGRGASRVACYLLDKLRG